MRCPGSYGVHTVEPTGVRGHFIRSRGASLIGYWLAPFFAWAVEAALLEGMTGNVVQ